MAWIDDVDELRADHARRLAQFMGNARRHFAAEQSSVEDQMRSLSRFRSDFSEATNQLQHEYMLLRLLAHLETHGVASAVARWAWHPTSTGTFDEPDLSGVDADGHQIIAAEVTTSARPIGVIDRRMAVTLAKLDGMAGQRFYCVGTEPMALRAETKVRRASYQITVLLIPSL